eukprot:m.224943 g.224943  ORF g.224943 m.224943 type:complete len:539 (+) comp15156_c0_seq1:296-1912(+)
MRRVWLLYTVVVLVGMRIARGAEAEGDPNLCEHGAFHEPTHRGHVVHCMCPQDRPMCVGTACAVGFGGEECVSLSSSCESVVHGYKSDCTDCECTSLTSDTCAVPTSIFVSLSNAEQDGTVLVNFALEGKVCEEGPILHFGSHRLHLDGRVFATKREADLALFGETSIWSAEAFIGHRYNNVTEMFYIVQNGPVVTRVHSTVVPQASETEAPFTIAVVGDMGTSYSAPLVMHALKADASIQALLHPGDISYAFKVPEVNLFFSRFQSLTSRVPYIVALGNHEANNPQVFSAYATRFPTDVLAARSGAESAHWYSADLAGLHLCVIDSQDALDTRSEQHKWLEKDLKQAHARRAGSPKTQSRSTGAQGFSPKTAVRWIAVVLHYPLYSTHRRVSESERRAKELQMQGLRRDLEPLLEQYHVDLVFCGHDHVYERTARVLHAERNPNGPFHLLVGTGGHNIYESWYNLPQYDEFRRAVPGYGKLTTFPNHTMLWEFVEVDISPCVRADLGGDRGCPASKLHSTHGKFIPPTRVIDSTWLS